MPTKRVHQDKQRIAQRALSHLQASQKSFHHADWIVTLAFYKALHAVDSYLANKCKIYPYNHQDRSVHVQKHLSNIYGDYTALYSASLRARYKDYTYQNNPQEVTNLLNMSMQIENHINTHL